jgi:NADH-quinone oxidoreductase subunit E
VNWIGNVGDIMFKLSDDGLKKVKAELTRYESKNSAIIPSLYIAQSENGGWVSDEVIDYLSQVMDIPTSQINEVFQFYSMFNKKTVGKYHVQICNNISCALNGSREMTAHVLKELNTKMNDVTVDGKFCISSVECLGSCGTAPMMQVNEDYHENLNNEKVMQILKGLK